MLILYIFFGHDILLPFSGRWLFIFSCYNLRLEVVVIFHDKTHDQLSN